MQWPPPPSSEAGAKINERSASACPGDEQLFSLALGEIDEVTQTSIETHVRRCADCREVLSEALRSLSGESETTGTQKIAQRVLLDRYELLEPIGSGGAGVVYRAFDPALKRTVAVKILRPDLPGSSEEFQIRLRQEAQATAQLSHPNVVTAYDVGATDSGGFIVLEYFSGGTLEEWLQGDHSLAERIRVMGEAGRGLAAAHEKGLVHRDFKPQNVLLSENGRVCVTDFGLARLDDENHLRGFHMDSTIGDATETRGLMGTPNYMAPEVFAGSRGDELSDQFSFSVALYQAVNGRHPFRGATDTTLAELLTRMQSGVIEPAAPGVPDNVREVIERGLSADRTARFPNMTELLAALESKPRRAISPRMLVAAATLLLLGGASFFLLPGNPTTSESARTTPPGQKSDLEALRPSPPPLTPSALAPTSISDPADLHGSPTGDTEKPDDSRPTPRSAAPPSPRPVGALRPKAAPPVIRKKAPSVSPTAKGKAPSSAKTDEARFKDSLRNPF